MAMWGGIVLGSCKCVHVVEKKKNLFWCTYFGPSTSDDGRVCEILICGCDLSQWWHLHVPVGPKLHDIHVLAFSLSQP